MPRRRRNGRSLHESDAELFLRDSEARIVRALDDIREGPVSRKAAQGWLIEIERGLVRLGHLKPEQCKTFRIELAQREAERRRQIIVAANASRQARREVAVQASEERRPPDSPRADDNRPYMRSTWRTISDYMQQENRIFRYLSEIARPVAEQDAAAIAASLIENAPDSPTDGTPNTDEGEEIIF